MHGMVSDIQLKNKLAEIPTTDNEKWLAIAAPQRRMSLVPANGNHRSTCGESRRTAGRRPLPRNDQWPLGILRKAAASGRCRDLFDDVAAAAAVDDAAPDHV